jgi:RNA polymerase sigma-70 factor (ECF subfamily)
MNRQGRHSPARGSDSPAASLSAGGTPAGGASPRVEGEHGPEAAPDERLARAAAQGDDVACGELVRRYRDRIYRVVYGYVGDPDAALDITQETLLQMLEGLPRFREQASFYTWLHRIAVNRCLDWGRERTRRPPSTSLDHPASEGWAEPADGRAASRPDYVLMAKELRSQIHAAIAAVPELYRIHPLRGYPVLLADVEGLSTREIAERLGCPLNTVKTRLYRGRVVVRRRLRAYLEDRG